MSYVVELRLRGAQDMVNQVNRITNAVQGLKSASSSSSGASAVTSVGASIADAARQAIKLAKTMDAVTAAARTASANLNLVARALRRLGAPSGPGGQPKAPPKVKPPVNQADLVMKALMKMISSTRVAVSGANIGAAMPLIGDVMKLAVALGLIAPEMLLLATGVMALAAAVAYMAKMATEAGVSFAQMQLASGTTFGTAAMGASFGAAAGVSNAQMTQIAAAFNEALKNNAYAASVMGGKGTYANYAGAFGDQDDMKRLMNGIDYMMSSRTSEKDAVRFAKGTPLEQFLWMRKADPEVRRQAVQSQFAAASPQNQKDAANAQVLFNTAMAKFQMMLIKLGAFILPEVVNFLDKVNYLLNGFMLLLAAIEDIAHGDYQFHMSKAALGRFPSGVTDDGKGAAVSDNVQAIDRNTQALNNVERALNNERQTFGGGPNAAGAIPKRFMVRGEGWNSPANIDKRRTIAMGQIPI